MWGRRVPAVAPDPGPDRVLSAALGRDFCGEGPCFGWNAVPAFPSQPVSLRVGEGVQLLGHERPPCHGGAGAAI